MPRGSRFQIVFQSDERGVLPLPVVCETDPDPSESRKSLSISQSRNGLNYNTTGNLGSTGNDLSGCWPPPGWILQLSTVLRHLAWQAYLQPAPHRFDIARPSTTFACSLPDIPSDLSHSRTRSGAILHNRPSLRKKGRTRFDDVPDSCAPFGRNPTNDVLGWLHGRWGTCIPDEVASWGVLRLP